MNKINKEEFTKDLTALCKKHGISETVAILGTEKETAVWQYSEDGKYSALMTLVAQELNELLRLTHKQYKKENQSDQSNT